MKVTDGTRGSSRDRPSTMTRSQSGVVGLQRWYTTCITSPVSTPHRSARNSNANSGSSWSAVITGTTSPALMRTSVSSWRCRTGPVSWSPKRRSRRALNDRSMSDLRGDRRADRSLRPMAAAILDQLLELHHPEDEPLGTGRAAGHVDIDRHNAVDPLDRGVAPLVAAARARAIAHRDAPLRLRHLLPEADEGSCHLRRERPRDDEDVGLARAGAEREHAPAIHVVAGRRGRHHLDRTAREARQ